MGLILWSVLFLAVHHHSALLSFAFACDIVQSLADCVGQGIKVQHESDRAKMTIKQVLEQRRLNDATGALVKEFFSSVSPAELQDKIAEIFHEFDTDHNGGLDRSVLFPSSPIFSQSLGRLS